MYYARVRETKRRRMVVYKDTIRDNSLQRSVGLFVRQVPPADYEAFTAVDGSRDVVLPARDGHVKVG
jgi:hypothetical protein